MTLIIRKYGGISPYGLTLNGRPVLENSGKFEFRKFLKSIYRYFELNYPKYFKMDGLSKLGFLSVESLLANDDLLNSYAPEKRALMLTNASSSLEVDTIHWDTIRDRNHYFPSPSNFVYTLPNIMGGEAAIRHCMKGENTILISEGFDVELICEITEAAFHQGIIDCCICGWVEQSATHYESLLFFVERMADNIAKQNSREDVIFEASKLLNIYKQHIEWKT